MKKTKIVATISDKRCEVEFLEKLYRAGMNVVRLNTAHQDMEQALKVVENVRKVSDNIAILIDTKGPEVRTMLMDEPMQWIRDKQKHTYVRINEKWQKCDFKYPGWVKK